MLWCTVHPFQYLSNRNLCLLSYTYTTNTCKMYTFIFHTLAWIYFWCTVHPHQYDIRAFITCDAAKPSWSIRDYIQGIVRHGNYQGLDYTGPNFNLEGLQPYLTRASKGELFDDYFWQKLQFSRTKRWNLGRWMPPIVYASLKVVFLFFIWLQRLFKKWQKNAEMVSRGIPKASCIFNQFHWFHQFNWYHSFNSTGSMDSIRSIRSIYSFMTSIFLDLQLRQAGDILLIY